MSPRTFPPAPGWSPAGHRLKAPLDYGRGPDRVWVYGVLRPGDGQALTQPALFRNTAGFETLLDAVDQANSDGVRSVIADHRSRYQRAPILAWLVAHPRTHIEPRPMGAYWLTLIEGRRRLVRWTAFCGSELRRTHRA